MAHSVNLTLTANQAKLVKVALNDYAQKRVEKFCSDKWLTKGDIAVVNQLEYLIDIINEETAEIV